MVPRSHTDHTGSDVEPHAGVPGACAGLFSRQRSLHRSHTDTAAANWRDLCGFAAGAHGPPTGFGTLLHIPDTGDPQPQIHHPDLNPSGVFLWVFFVFWPWRGRCKASVIRPRLGAPRQPPASDLS